MEQRTGRLAAFFQSGPVQFVGAAGLAVAVAVGFNTFVENANSAAPAAMETLAAPAEAPVAAPKGAPVSNALDTDTSSAKGVPVADAATDAGPKGVPVVDAPSHPKGVERPYVPQEDGNGVTAFTAGQYDWQTFQTRANDLAPNVTSPYADDYIRALPTAADRAAVLGTGPHNLLHDTKGQALGATYLSQHYHLGAEGLAVAVSDNPAYEHSPIRAIAGDGERLAQAGAIGKDPEALRALIKDVHATRVAMTPEIEATIGKMQMAEMATYALVVGEATYVVSDIQGSAKGKEQAALLVMAGAEANYQSTRTHGKFHDMPQDAGWKEQIASANAVARFEKIESAKTNGTFKGLQGGDAPLSIAESPTPKAAKTTQEMR